MYKLFLHTALVYSKGVLNHVRENGGLFREISRVLKTKRWFIIADWIYHDTRKVDDTSPLVNETQESYQKILEDSGFTNISFRNDTPIFISYVKKLLPQIMTRREFIEKEFGADIFSIIWRDHEKLIDEMNNKQKFATRIKAKNL